MKIHELVLFPSSICNLHCKHCSYLCNSLKKDNVPIKRLLEIIDEAISLGTELFILVAKEPLMEIGRTKKILEHLEKRKVKYGIVTNGTLIKQNIDKLKNFNFNYFDVSIDGTEEYHDKTRGNGNFKLSEEGIGLILKNNITKTLFISSVLMSYNYKNIPEMINHFKSKGIQNFSLGAYIYTGKNPKEWILEKEQLKELIQILSNTKDVNQIIIDIHKQVNHYWDYLIEEKIIDKDKIETDENNVVYYQIPNTKVFLKNSLFTTKSDYTGIITADGFYLEDYNYLTDPNYKKSSVGNIKTKKLSEILAIVQKQYYIPSSKTSFSF